MKPGRPGGNYLRLQTRRKTRVDEVVKSSPEAITVKVGTTPDGKTIYEVVRKPK